MSITITLPQSLEDALRRVADERNASVEDFALEILVSFMKAGSGPSPEEVVAGIRARPATACSEPSGSQALAEALRESPEDPQFDTESWRRDWDAVEAEMKALSRAEKLTESF